MLIQHTNTFKNYVIDLALGNRGLFISNNFAGCKKEVILVRISLRCENCTYEGDSCITKSFLLTLFRYLLRCFLLSFISKRQEVSKMRVAESSIIVCRRRVSETCRGKDGRPKDVFKGGGWVIKCSMRRTWSETTELVFVVSCPMGG